MSRTRSQRRGAENHECPTPAEVGEQQGDEQAGDRTAGGRSHRKRRDRERLPAFRQPLTAHRQRVGKGRAEAETT